MTVELIAWEFKVKKITKTCRSQLEWESKLCCMTNWTPGQAEDDEAIKFKLGLP